MSLRVTEIFFSIQGETTKAGLPCVFVRFTGCNLRCGYCDTAYAFHGGGWRTIEEILDEVGRHPTRYVTLTGGEPLLQKELPLLAEELLARGYLVAIETHGQLSWEKLPAGVVKIVDVKTPSSGEAAKEEHLRMLSTLGPSDELKFVVGSREDFDWAVEIVRRFELEGKHGALLISPIWGEVAYDELSAWILESGLDLRMQIQLHKLIWGPEATGV